MTWCLIIRHSARTRHFPQIGYQAPPNTGNSSGDTHQYVGVVILTLETLRCTVMPILGIALNVVWRAPFRSISNAQR